VITEADALENAQSDARRLQKKIHAGALVSDIAKALVVRVLYHINSFENPQAMKLAQQAAQKKMNAPTISEHLTARCISISTIAMRALQPEDSRALALWLIGAPPQVPGFLTHAIHAIGETSGEEAVERANTYVTGLLNQMQQRDQDLFTNQINVLSSPRQHIVRGLLLDAQWAFEGRDGGTARLRVISARKMAQKWLKDNQEQAELLG